LAAAVQGPCIALPRQSRERILFLVVLRQQAAALAVDKITPALCRAEPLEVLEAAEVTLHLAVAVAVLAIHHLQAHHKVITVVRVLVALGGLLLVVVELPLLAQIIQLQRLAVLAVLVLHLLLRVLVLLVAAAAAGVVVVVALLAVLAVLAAAVLVNL
jgi:hypothetical protein